MREHVYIRYTHTHTHTHTHMHITSGTDLSICTTTTRQCCLQSYIESAMMVANEKLNTELRYRLRGTSSEFNNTVNSIYGCKSSFVNKSFTMYFPKTSYLKTYSSINSGYPSIKFIKMRGLL